MTGFVALLGSINVGGNRIAMADLRQAFAAEGYLAPRTVIASGNLLFDAVPDGVTDPERHIADVVAQRFAIQSFVTVRGPDEIDAAIADNPFADSGAPNMVHGVFLDGEITDEALAAVTAANPGRERIAKGPRMLHIDMVDGVAGSRLTSAFIHKHTGRRSTARNLRSLRRIAEAMR